MISTAAVLDLKVNKAQIASYSTSVRGDAKAASRFLSALKADCEQRRTAWQVYRNVKREAIRAGLISR